MEIIYLKEIATIRAKVEFLDKQSLIARDKRLEYWSVIAPSSSGKHSVANKELAAVYNNLCVVCGRANPTMAHIVSGNSRTEYPDFNGPKYKTNIDNKSPRNYLPLCGILGAAGTCHNEFDQFLLTFFYNPISRNYKIISLNDKWENHHLHGTEINFPHNPYNRLLVWRTRKCFLEHGVKFSNEQIEAIVNAVELSEETRSLSSSVNNSDNLEEDLQAISI